MMALACFVGQGGNKTLCQSCAMELMLSETEGGESVTITPCLFIGGTLHGKTKQVDSSLPHIYAPKQERDPAISMQSYIEEIRKPLECYRREWYQFGESRKTRRVVYVHESVTSEQAILSVEELGVFSD